MKGFTAEIKTLQLKALEETAGNPQKMPDKTFTGLVNSIKRKGWYFAMPDVWEYEPGKYRIISGHHRIRAAIKAGLIDQNCNVITDPSYTEEQAKKDLLESNERHGAPDDLLLTDFVEDLMADYNIEIDTLIDEIGINNFYNLDNFDEDFNLPEGDKESFQQMTFVLSNKQADFIKEILSNLKLEQKYLEFDNENSNGNKLFKVFKEWQQVQKI